MMPLIMADPGEENIIRRVGGSPEMKKHLEDLGFTAGSNVTVMNTIGGNLIVKVRESRMDMGITRGVEIYVRKLAPLGDPVEVTVRGYELSLRKADAEMIEVE